MDGLTIYIANSPIIIDHHRSPTLREAIDHLFRSPLFFKWQSLVITYMWIHILTTKTQTTYLV